MNKLWIVALLCSGQIAFAQNAKVDLAEKQLKKYHEDHKPKNIQNARENIDDAAADESTKNLVGTWLTRGDIYMDSYTESGIENRKPELTAAICAKDTFLQVATESYLHAKELDWSGKYGERVNPSLNACNRKNQENGIENYGAGQFGVAANCFGRSFAISVAQGKPDSLILYNAALAGYKARQFDKAIAWSKMLTATNYSGKDSWWLLTQCYVELGDTAGARKSNDASLIGDPENTAFLYQKVDIQLACGNFKAADEVMLNFVEGGSWTDSFTNCKVGNGYDQVANPTSSDGTALAKPWNYEALINRAEFYYREALRIQPGYFDAQYNLGILFYNQGVQYSARWNSQRPDAAKYENMWQPKLKIAAVELEIAHTINPKDKMTLTGLKVCYGQLGDVENYQRVRELLKGL